TENILPNATKNKTYGPIQLQASGGSGPLAWSAAGLPPGFVLTTTGALEGTPAGSGNWGFPIRVTDVRGRSFSKKFSLNVDGAPGLRINPEEDSGDFTFGQPISRTLSVSGGAAPYSWSVSGLPRGLRLRTDAPFSVPFGAEIWGTPLELGTFPVTVRLEDSS